MSHQKVIDDYIEKLKVQHLEEPISIVGEITALETVIPLLMGGIYKSLAHVGREYVSNALDSDSETQEIRIYIPPAADIPVISFYDYGRGMNEEELLHAVIFGGGEKEHGGDTIGELGIGIYAGGATCEKLIIMTKKAGMEYELKAELPVKEWMRYRKERKSLRTIAEATNFSITKQRIPLSEKSKHYTNVQLHNLREDITEQLSNPEEYEKFIFEFTNVLPIRFNQSEWPWLYKRIEENLHKYAIKGLF